MSAPERFASWSGGADSTAQIILALEHGEPLTAAVYCEIMYSQTRSAEVPEHRDFIYETAIPWLERQGVTVIVLRSKKTALEWMMSRSAGGKAKGKYTAFRCLEIRGGAALNGIANCRHLTNFGRTTLAQSTMRAFAPTKRSA